MRYVLMFHKEKKKKKGKKYFQMEQVTPIFNEHYLLDPSRFQSELREYRKYIKSMVETIGTGNMSTNYANDILEFSTKVAKVNYLNHNVLCMRNVSSYYTSRLWRQTRNVAARIIFFMT